MAKGIKQQIRGILKDDIFKLWTSATMNRELEDVSNSSVHLSQLYQSEELGRVLVNAGFGGVTTPPGKKEVFAYYYLFSSKWELNNGDCEWTALEIDTLQTCLILGTMAYKVGGGPGHFTRQKVKDALPYSPKYTYRRLEAVEKKFCTVVKGKTNTLTIVPPLTGDGFDWVEHMRNLDRGEVGSLPGKDPNSLFVSITPPEATPEPTPPNPAFTTHQFMQNNATRSYTGNEALEVWADAPEFIHGKLSKLYGSGDLGRIKDTTQHKHPYRYFSLLWYVDGESRDNRCGWSKREIDIFYACIHLHKLSGTFSFEAVYGATPHDYKTASNSLLYLVQVGLITSLGDDRDHYTIAEDLNYTIDTLHTQLTQRDFSRMPTHPEFTQPTKVPEVEEEKREEEPTPPVAYDPPLMFADPAPPGDKLEAIRALLGPIPTHPTSYSNHQDFFAHIEYSIKGLVTHVEEVLATDDYHNGDEEKAYRILYDTFSNATDCIVVDTEGKEVFIK